VQHCPQAVMLFNASNARNACKLHQRAADGTPTAAVSLNTLRALLALNSMTRPQVLAY